MIAHHRSDGMTESSAWWIILVMVIGSAAAANVPFAFDESPPSVVSYSADELEKVRASTPELEDVPSISPISDGDVIEFSETGGGDKKGSKKFITIRELKDIFNSRVEPENPTVHREALTVTANYPGDLTIEQICSVYEFLKKGDRVRASWSYVPDPRGIDYYSYANETLAVGKDTGRSGVGDCDDFAILMSALIESVGGTTRIVLAYNESGSGHAYAEVYLGRIDSANESVEDVVQWLRLTYNVDKVYTHIDSDNRDVWLNLDWGADPTGHSNPGGELYKGDKHVVVGIRDKIDKTPVRPPEGFQPINQVTPDPWGTNPQPSGNVMPGLEGSSKVEVKPLEGQDAKDAGAWTERGIALNNEGKYQEAITCYDNALNLDPGNYLVWELKGLALRSQGMYEESITCFDKAIEIDPSQDYAWRDKGELLYTMGYYSDAVLCFERAIDARNCGDYWNMKGEALMAMGRHGEASHAFVIAQSLGECVYD